MNLSLLRRSLAALAFSIMAAAAVLLTAVPSASAAGEPIEGFLGARFGMSVEDVRAAAQRDGVTDLGLEEEGKDVLLSGRYEADGMARTVLYVFPNRLGKLALVIEFHEDLDRAPVLESQLTGRFGAPMDEDATKLILEHAGDQLPAGVETLRVWAGKANGSDRMARLMTFSNYLAIEYLDTTLLRGDT